MLNEDIPLNFPIELKDKIKENYYRLQSMLPNSDESALEYLYKIYNIHVDRYPNDRRCPDCRRMIYRYWAMIVSKWEANG